MPVLDSKNTECDVTSREGRCGKAEEEEMAMQTDPRQSILGNK